MTTLTDEIILSLPLLDKDQEEQNYSGALTDCLQKMGLDVYCVKAYTAPQVIVYEFCIDDYKGFSETKLKRAVKLFGIHIHKAIFLNPGFYADFAIEIQREHPYKLDFVSVLLDRQEKKNNAYLGYDEQNNLVSLDMRKGNHVLIGGTTGSGKSVLLKTMISSLIINDPTNSRFIMIDPKQVELGCFACFSQVEAVITQIDQAMKTLDIVCNMITNRYRVMEKQQINNIAEMQNPFPEYYIVIDELADLMLQSKKRVETLIVRIAQLGRAAGIHLIIATQRPDRSVVTGLIKANIPTQIALATANSYDSRTILGHGGAEKLLGNGDAIIKYPDTIEEKRFQVAYTSNEDIKQIALAVRRWQTDNGKNKNKHKFHPWKNARKKHQYQENGQLVRV